MQNSEGSDLIDYVLAIDDNDSLELADGFNGKLHKGALSNAIMSMTEVGKPF